MNDHTSGEDHLRSLRGELERCREREQESEARYRRQTGELEAIYRLAPVGLCVFDTQLRYLRINDRLAEINGVTAEEHLGKTLREVLPALADEAEHLTRRILETGEPILNAEFSGETPARPGVERFWNEHWFPLKDETGQVWGINVVVEEITDRKRAEQALQERERQLAEALAFNERVIAASSVGTTVYNRSGQCVLANEAAARATGATREQLLRQNFRQLDSWRKSGLLQLAEQSLATGEPTTRNIHVVTSFGREVWLNCRFIPFVSEGEPHLTLMFDDITDQKQMEQALDESEARYRRQAEELEVIYRRAPIGLAVLDREIRYMRVNDRLAEINGVAAEAHVGKTLREVVPSVADLAEDLARRILATGEAVLNVEFRGETRAQPGVERFWNEHLLPLKDEAGEVWGINVVVEEITDRKRAEQSLREREAFTNHILATSQNGIYIYDFKLGRHVYVNAQYTRLSGFRLEDLIALGSEGFLALFTPEDQALLASHLQAVAQASDEEAIEFEYRARIADGRRIWCLSRDAVFARNPDGSASQMIGTFLDITERKRAEQALRESEQRLRLVTDALPVLVSYMDADERYQFVNAAYEQWFGIPRDQLIGRPAVEIIGKEAYERVRDYMHRARAGERVHYLAQMPYLRGPQRDVEAIFVPHRNESGEVLGFYAFVQDVSELMEHKRSEEALRASEERLALSQKIAGIGSFDWQAPTERVVWSEGLEHLYGLQPGEYRGTYEEWFNRVHPADQTTTEKSVTNAIEQRQEWRTEYRIIRKDGAIRWIFALGRPIFDEAGQFIRFLGINLDITERKEAEEALRERESELLEAQRIANMGSWMRDPRRDTIKCSSQAYQIFGLDEHSPLLTNKKLQEIFTPESLTRLTHAADQAIETGEAFEVEVEVVRPDGVQRQCIVRGVADRATEGTVTTLHGTFQDITALRQTEQALQTNERLLRLALDHFPGPIAIYDGQRRFRYVNAFGRQLTGLTLEEHIGRLDEEIRPQTTHNYLPLLIRAFETRTTQTEEATVSLPEGDRFFMLNYIPILNNKGEIDYVLGIALDMTERRRSEEDLRHLNQRLQQTLAELRATQEQVIQTEKVVALGTMAAGIAHELNNPLMGVMGYVNYAHRHPTDPRNDELLTGAEQELGRMRDLIRSMLSFARHTREEPTPIDLPRLISHALELVVPDLKARGITVTVEIENELSRVIATPQLEQAILNLLLNARDAVNDMPEKKITILAWSKGEQVFIQVADSGPGVPDGIRTRIFDPFFTTKPPGEGTGLGLSVSRTLIEDLGGSLTVESHEGEGARFLICLNKSHLQKGDDVATWIDHADSVDP